MHYSAFMLVMFYAHSILQKCGRLEDQIELLKQKLTKIYQGEAFNGKSTKTARSHGRKFQVTVKQETSRILVPNEQLLTNKNYCENLGSLLLF